MNWLGILITAGVVIFDLGVVWAIVKIGWSPWQNRYPAREPSPDAVRRNFQSFRFGLMNFGYAVHVAADEDYLHLRPIVLLRWVGAGPISIPWSSIQSTGKKILGRWMSVKVDSKTVVGPVWCLELAGDTGA